MMGWDFLKKGTYIKFIRVLTRVRLLGLAMMAWSIWMLIMRMSRPSALVESARRLCPKLIKSGRQNIHYGVIGVWLIVKNGSEWFHFYSLFLWSDIYAPRAI